MKERTFFPCVAAFPLLVYSRDKYEVAQAHIFKHQLRVIEEQAWGSGVRE